MTLVCFHPELGIIITGSEDGTVRVWHSTTYRLENTLNYGLERVWAVGYMKISRRVVIGYDEGTIITKIGKEVPVASMDYSVKIIWANHSDVLSVNIKSVGADYEITDGEQFSLAVKDLGSCDLYPQSLKHILSGRFVVVCGDGEYIIYTTLAWRNRSVWSVDGEYAVKESTSRIQVTTLFHLDWPIYLLGYLANQSRVCVIEKEFNVTGYTLLLSMIQYKTLVMRRGLERASQLLPSIPKHLYSEARFLESREMLEDALEVATAMEDPFADPTEDFFCDGPVMGTLIMGSRAPDDVGVVSCDSRTSTSRLSIHGWVINSGPITITTDPDEKEHGVVQERIYKKYFIKEHYVIILAGPLDLSNQIIRVLEVAAVERIVSNLTVDIDYLSEVLNKEMDRRSRLEKGCIVKLCSFILVALTKDKKLMMRAFGFKHGNKNSGKLDITTSWCGGSPSKVKAREVLKKEMMISKTIRQIYHSHHMAMLAGAEAAEKDQKSIGGNHTIIVVSVVDGKLKTLTKSMVIDKYYRQFEFDLK